VRSNQNRKATEVDFARETRGSILRRIPPPKSERVRRTWIPTTSLLTSKGKIQKVGNKVSVALRITLHNPHSGRLSLYVFFVIRWEYGNYINDGLSKEEPKRGGVPEYFGRGVDR
jgi:hypothetical protein